MRIIITGGAGFIGSHIADAYVAGGHDVLVLDSLWEHGGGRRANIPERASFVHMDIRDENVARIFQEFRPDVVSHHAAQHSVAISSRDPKYDADVNVMGLINVLDASVKVRREEGALCVERRDVWHAGTLPDHGSDPAKSHLAVRYHEDGGRALSAVLQKRKGTRLHGVALRQRVRPAAGS